MEEDLRTLIRSLVLLGLGGLEARLGLGAQGAKILHHGGVHLVAGSILL